MQRKLLFFVFLTLWMIPLVVGAEDLTLQQVIDKCTEAAGGKQAIEAVKSIAITLNIEEPKFSVQGHYVADRKLRMRIDVHAEGKRVYTEAYDGKTGWEMGEKGAATEATALGTAALWHGIVKPGKLFGLSEQEGLGNHLELEGRELVDGVNYYVLKLTLKDGFVVHYFVNPDTWFLERNRDTRALHPDLDTTEKLTEARNSDFRKVDGVVYAFKSTTVDLKTGTVLSTDTISEIKINPDLDEAQFRKP